MAFVVPPRRVVCTQLVQLGFRQPPCAIALRGRSHVPTPLDDRRQRGLQRRGQADPGQPSLTVDDRGHGQAVELGVLEVANGRAAPQHVEIGRRPRRDGRVPGHVESHRAAAARQRALDGFQGVAGIVGAGQGDHADAAVPEAIGQVGGVGHPAQAGPAPYGPEIEHIHRAALEALDGRAAQPALDGERRGRVADGEQRAARFGEGSAGGQAQRGRQARGPHGC